MQTIQHPPLLSPVTTDDIRDLDIHLPTLKVVSYSGPGKTGGVPTSLEPIVQRLGTKVHWFSVETPEKETTPGNSLFPQASGNRYSFAPNDQTAFEYYSAQASRHAVEGHRRVCARYLWPLLHGMSERAEFDVEDWKAYRQLCARVASECQAVSAESFPTLCWLNDYQLALIAPLIASHRGTVVCHFWHVPWPQAKKIAASPIARELVDALLYNRVLGFHTAEYAHNFMETVESLFPTAIVDHMEMVISYSGRRTQVTVMPLGIDVNRWQKLAHVTRPLAEVIPVKHRLANQILLGVDRLDYSKGVLEKLEGLERFLNSSPDMRRRFHYVQISQPPQSQEAMFTEYATRVKEKIDSINETFGVDGWKPIVHLEAHLDQKELAAWYQAADVMTVNPVRDGLNLIAKEYVACRQDEQGVLILSENAGCAAELSQGAIMVNPAAPDEFANAIGKALSMGIEEKRRRMTSMRHVIGWNQLHDWALGFLKQSL